MEVKPWTGIFEDWIFHLVCLLQEWKKYTFKVVNPKGIIIDLIPFISNKTLYTVWKEKYNDLQTWIASTNKDISLFSKKYQKIKDANNYFFYYVLGWTLYGIFLCTSYWRR